MSIESQLNRIATAKADMATELARQGVTVPADTKIEAFPALIRSIEAVSITPERVYAERPADWLPMPQSGAAISLLCHIPAGGCGLLAFKVECTGSYTVQIGTMVDGAFSSARSETITSSEVFETKLNAVDFGNETSTGMRQAMIIINGEDITSFEPAEHSLRTGTYYYSFYNVVEANVMCMSVTQMRFGLGEDNSCFSGLVYARIGYLPNAIDMSEMFMRCEALKAVVFTYVRPTRAVRTFLGCRSLQAISPLWGYDCEDAESIFEECTSLTWVPNLNLTGVRSLKNAFCNCPALKSVTAMYTHLCEDFDSAFYGCSSLKSVPPLEYSAARTMLLCFGGCTGLSEISIATPAVENVESMVSNCTSLKVIDLGITSPKRMSGFASYCTALQTVKNLDFSRLESSDWGIFNTCPALSVIEGHSNMASAHLAVEYFQLDLSYCSLGLAALTALFAKLPIADHPATIALTGNPITSAELEGIVEAASAKNWTVVL